MSRSKTNEMDCNKAAYEVKGLMNGMMQPVFLHCSFDQQFIEVNDAFLDHFPPQHKREKPKSIEFLYLYFDKSGLNLLFENLSVGEAKNMEINTTTRGDAIATYSFKPLKYLTEQGFIWLIVIESIGSSFNEKPKRLHLANKSLEMLDVLDEIVFRFDQHLRLVLVNQAYCKFIGKPREELIGKYFIDFVQPSEQKRIYQYVKSLFQNPGLKQYEYLEEFEDGTYIWWEWSDYPVLDKDGNVIEIQTVGRNITERKKTEEQNKAMESVNALILNNVPDLLFFLSKEGVYLDVKTKSESDLFVPKEQFLGKKIIEVLPEAAANNAMEALREAIQTNKVVGYTYSLQLTAGERFYENRIVPVNHELALAIIRDITVSRRAEIALQESEQRWKFALEGNRDGLWDWNIADNRVYFSNQWRRLLGYEVMDEIGVYENWESRIHPDEKDLVLHGLREALDRSDGLFRAEYRLRNRFDQYIWILDRGKVMERDQAGKALRVIGTITDITERKEVEQALIDSEQRWKFALEGNGDGLWDWNLKTNTVFFSNQWKAMLGYIDSEIPNVLSSWSKLVHPDDIDNVMLLVQDYINGITDSYTSEHRLLCKNGSYKWVLDRGKIIEYDSEGAPLRMIGTHTDINERKQIEQKLVASEKRYQSVVDTQKEMICRFKPDTTLVFVNKAYSNMMGLSESELIGCKFIDFIPAEERPEVTAHLETVSDSLQSITHEHRFITTDGEIIWHEWTDYPIIIEHGVVTEFQSVGTDITERKRTEALIRKQSAELESFFSLSKDLLGVLNEDLQLLRASAHWVDVVNLPLSNIINAAFLNFVHQDDRAITKENIVAFKDRRAVGKFENRIVASSGDIRFVEWNIVEHDAFIYISGRDVTDKHFARNLILSANEKLKESSRMMQTIFDIIPGRLFWKDKESRYLGANKNFLNDAGLNDISELIGKSDFDLHWDRLAESYQKDDRFVIENNSPKIRYEEKQTTLDGQTLWLQTSKIPLKDNAGNTIGVFGTYEDITNRKNTELAFQANERFLRKLLLLINDSLKTTDTRQVIADLSKKMKGLFDADNCFVTQWDDLKHQTIPILADDEKIDYASKKGIKEEKTLTQSLMEEGQIITVEDAFNSPYLSRSVADEFESRALMGIPLINGDQKIGAFIIGYNQTKTFTISDIERANLAASIVNVVIARNQFMENLEASEKMMRSFIQNAPIGILAFNSNGKFNIGNEAAFNMFGFSETELMASSLLNIAAPESSEIITDFMKRLHDKGSATADVLMKHNNSRDFWCAIYGVRLNQDLFVSFFVDVTERVNAKNDLEHEKSLLKGLLNSIPDVVFYKDLNGNYIGANPQFTKITGFLPDQYIGKTSNDLFDQALATELNRFDADVIKFKNEIVHTNHIIDKNGNNLPLETIKAPFYNTSGDLIGILGLARDISERLQKEEALRKSSEFLEDITMHAPGVLFQYLVKSDGVRKFTYVSAGVEKLFGLTPQQVVDFPERVFEMIHHDDLDVLSQSITNSFEKLTPWHLDFRIVPAQGKPEWISGLALPKRIDENTVVGYGFLKNVTLEKDNQKRLEESENRFHLALHFTESGLWDWDLESGKVYFSDTWKTMLEYDVDWQIDTFADWRKLWHPDDEKLVENTIDDYLNGKTSAFEVEYRMKNHNGDWQWILTRGELIRDENGSPVRWLGTNIDISRLKNLESDLLFRASLQNLLMTMAGRMINLPLHLHAQAINEILSQVGQLVQADRSYIFNFNEDHTTTSNTYEWCAEGIEPQIEYLQDVPVDQLKDWMAAFDQGSSYIIDDVFALPEGDPAREILAPQGIKSLLSVPMLFEQKKIGFIGFDAVHVQKNWSDVEKELLHFFAEILVSMEVRKSNELALIESENMLSMAADAARTAIWKWDLETNLISYNNQMSVMLGFESEKIPENPDAYFNRIFKDDFDKVLGEINNCLTSKSQAFEMEYRILHLNGDILWIHDKGIVVQQSGDGTPKHLIGTRTDITSRKIFELELKESEQRFKSIYNNTSIGLYRTTHDGKILMVNPALIEILGYDSVDQLQGVNFVNKGLAMQPERMRFLEIMETNGEVKGFETVWVKKGGEKVNIRENAVAIRDEKGQILYFDGSVEDITERNKQEEALKESEAKFRELAESVDDAFWLHAVGERKLIYANPAMNRILGLANPDYLIDFAHFATLIHPEDAEMVREAYTAYLLDETAVFDLQFRIIISQGELRWIRARSSKIKNEKGETIRHAGIATDVTQQKELEIQMQQSIALEKQLGELKTRFVSMASHELRTPLATIMATIETLKAYWPKMTEKDIETRLDKIGFQGSHLRKIMNDVLNYSKTTTGKASFEPVVSDLYELINEIVEEFKSLPIFNHQLKLELDQSTLMFEFDVNLMRQIISNLLSNAFKYTDKGGLVVLNCSPTKDGVRLEIIDEGIGIPENELPNLFDPFFRASNSLNFQGTGLGLPIVKEAVQLHNGIIKAENNIPKGTKFTIELPTNQNYEKDVPNFTD